MNTQVCIDALREIRRELPQAIQAGDRKTVRWRIANIVGEVEHLARQIRTDADKAITQLEAPGVTDDGDSTP